MALPAGKSSLRDEMMLGPFCFGFVVLASLLTMGPPGAIAMGATAAVGTIAAFLSGREPERPIPVWARLAMGGMGCLVFPYLGPVAVWLSQERVGDAWAVYVVLWFLGAACGWLHLVLALLSGGWRIWTPFATLGVLLLAATVLLLVS